MVGEGRSRMDIAVTAGLACGALLFVFGLVVMIVNGTFRGEELNLVLYNIPNAVIGFFVGFIGGLFFHWVQTSGAN